jgi:signal transduction histidine kinase
MKLGGLSWRLLGGIALVVVLALGASFWLFTAELERLRDAELTEQLLAEARLLSYALRESWGARDAHPVAEMSHALHNEGTDVVVLVTDGSVLVDTFDGGIGVESLLEQPEVRAALAYGTGTATRSGLHGPSASRVVAVRVGRDAAELGVVWLARPRWTFVTHARSFGRTTTVIGAIALVTILGLGLALTRRWTALLRRLGRAAQSLAEGDLAVRAEIGGADEFALLAQSLNEMRRRLLAQVDTIDRQRRTLEALLDQLNEGVIAADADGRIILLNPAAQRLLSLDAPGAEETGLLGRALEECLPQHELQQILRPQPRDDAASAPRAAEARLRIETPEGVVHLLARATDLRLPEPAQGARRTSAGRLVVLTDVTPLQRALELQSDFVANASHELRTPLSSIRAAVETLQHMDVVSERDAAGRFLDVIDRHSARLTALTTDLLDLSRLQSPTAPWGLARLKLDEFLRELTERFAEAVRSKGLHWKLSWEPRRPATLVASPHLLRLVLDNLVDNAIQFTAPGGHVCVACRAEPGTTVFEVNDDGCGIPEAEQERVFERFYQVERARSGAQRGTGLGLAIVRDAAKAMGAAVHLSSTVGVGTRVTVTLPASGNGAEGW